MPRELRESLIEALYDRVDLWQRDPTSEAVFGPAADDEVARLVETPGFAGDLVGRHAAGMLFWCRFLALVAGEVAVLRSGRNLADDDRSGWILAAVGEATMPSAGWATLVSVMRGGSGHVQHRGRPAGTSSRFAA